MGGEKRGGAVEGERGEVRYWSDPPYSVIWYVGTVSEDCFISESCEWRA